MKGFNSLKDLLNAPEFKKNVKEEAASQSIDDAIRAADAFIAVFKQTVRDMAGARYTQGELGPTALDAILDISYDPEDIVVKDVNGRQVAEITFMFNGDLARESLWTEGHPDGVDNIINLLDKGFNGKRGPYGEWHGKATVGLAAREGAGFIKESVEAFMAKYSKEHNVIDMKISNEYK
jgi:hypothetical protein